MERPKHLTENEFKRLQNYYTKRSRLDERIEKLYKKIHEKNSSPLKKLLRILQNRSANFAEKAWLTNTAAWLRIPLHNKDRVNKLYDPTYLWKIKSALQKHGVPYPDKDWPPGFPSNFKDA